VAIEELCSGASIVNNDRPTIFLNRNCIWDFSVCDRPASIHFVFAKLPIKILDQLFFRWGVLPQAFAGQSENAECLYLARMVDQEFVSFDAYALIG